MPNQTTVVRDSSCARYQSILVVEDEPLVSDMIMMALEDFPCTVVSTVTAERALREIEAGLEPRILISNVKLPGSMDGLMLARELRHRMPDLGVIMISGHIAYVEENGGMEQAELLQKPFRIQRLMDVVGALLRTGGG